jgi:hypothetical protein
MRYDTFLLQLEATSTGAIRAKVVQSPAGQGSALLGSSIDLEADRAPLVGGRRLLRGAGSPTAEPPSRGVERLAPLARSAQETGEALFEGLFQGRVRALLDQSLGSLHRSPDRGLRIQLKLDPNEPALQQLAELPWELLCRGDTDDFLALSRRTPLVRFLDVARPAQPISFRPPLRILAVSASPTDLPALDLRKEAELLRQLAEKDPRVEVEILQDASVGRVRDLMLEKSFHVLHFMGHGEFDASRGEGQLLFEGSDGRSQPISGRTLATKLKDMHDLGVVVLNACSTAKSASSDAGLGPFRGVATALVLGGIPAVVAMQSPISDAAAIALSRAFYRQLANGLSVDEALTEGRQAISSEASDSVEWAIPVLFSRVPDGNVFRLEPVAPLPTAPAQTPPAFVTPAVDAPPARAPRRHTPARWLGGGAAAAAVLVVALNLDRLTPKESAVKDPPSAEGRQPSGNTLPAEPANAGKASSGQPLQQEPASAGEQRRRSASTTTKSPTTQAKPEPSKTEIQPTTPPVEPGTPPQGSLTPGPAAPATASPTPIETLSNDPDLLAVSITNLARRSSGGLQVGLSLRNLGALTLALEISREDSYLSDDQGMRYYPQKSNLPGSDTTFRVRLGAGDSTTAYLDFPAPKLGSTTARLVLTTASGIDLVVANTSQPIPAGP